MTLDEAIDKRFKNIDDLESVKVRVHCTLTVPTRSGQCGKCFFKDVIHYEGSKAYLKLLPHYNCYKDWEISNHEITPPTMLCKPVNEFEACVKRSLYQMKDVTMRKLFEEFDNEI